MVILTEDQKNPLSQPTKANILRAMHWLVKDAMPDDSLFIHFSGIPLFPPFSPWIQITPRISPSRPWFLANKQTQATEVALPT